MRSLGNWKFIVGAASFAAIVSILASTLRGVPFGSVVARALVGGIAFAIFAFVVGAIIERFFPDLKEAMNSSPSAAASGPGAGVDITLDEENPHADAEELEAVRELQEANSGESDPDENIAAIGTADPSDATAGHSAEDGEYMQGDEEPAGDGGDEAVLFAVEVEEVSGEAADAEEVEEIEPVEEIGDIDSAPSTESTEQSESARFDGLDSFDSGKDGSVVSNRSKVDLMGAEQEPEDLAKAVRTLMNRDQEG